MTSRAVGEWAAKQAALFHVAQVGSLVTALESDSPGQALSTLRHGTPSKALSTACTQARALLRDGAAADSLASALQAALAVRGAGAFEGDVDVVWTGPASNVTSTRLTAPVIAELIRDSSSEIILVSFAAQNEPMIVEELTKAVARGVFVTLITERSEDNPKFSGTTKVLPGLKIRRLVWPKAARQPGAALHAKVLVADGRVALVGSANLTGYALEKNLECGVLIRGGNAPGRIRDHLTSLHEQGVLKDA